MTMEAKRSRPTLQDIADRIGITKMTVSRYMRNPDSVAQATRDKIEELEEAKAKLEDYSKQLERDLQECLENNSN